MSKRFITGVIAACAVWLTSTAGAAVFTFDPDGEGGVNAPLVVGGFVMAPGSTLFQFPGPDLFQFSHQAALSSLNNAVGNPIPTPGLNSTFEITVVSSVRFVRTLTNGVVVKVAAVQPANSFIEIWFDGTPDADSLAGTGYNDGTLIYFGTPTAALSSLLAQVADGGPSVPYDQFGVDDYPGQTIAISTGSYFFGSTTNLQDPSFFVTPVESVELTTGIETPYDVTNPSALFSGLPGGAPPLLAPFVDGLPFQADATLNFAVPVPEPTGAGVITGAGVVALAVLPLLKRRRDD